jgi:2-polyprenyl-6-methoxyphenol hydroxylase-like FAD-dependent oxidoreductase
MKNGKILISGAGIAGPTLAYWLRRYGCEPVLIERAPALRTGGYLVDFWGLGFDVAERMALAPALYREGYHITEVRIVDDVGRKAGGFKADSIRTVLGDRFTSILRSDLSRLIYEALEDHVPTIFGDTVTAIEQRDDGVLVRFKHRAPERFDLLVGADGLHSVVRSLVFGPEDTFEKYLGYYVASFSSASYPHWEHDAFISYAAPGRQVSRYTLRDGRTVFFFIIASDKKLAVGPHDAQAQKQVLRDTFGHDGWECRQIFEALDGADDLYFDAVSQIQMPSWVQGRVAVVGDACFGPSLLAGQGSSLAMGAAYILAGELAKVNGDYGIAFKRYEDMLRPVMEGKQRAARSFAGSFAPKTRWGIYLRNRITALMSQPFVAKFFMGKLLTDPIALPDYPGASGPPLSGRSGSQAAPRTP